MNPELEEQLELERLIEEQRRDDSGVEMTQEVGHKNDISIHGLDNTLAVGEEGELIDLTTRERGSVLCGSADWHGTLTGARKHRCKCDLCRRVSAEYQRDYRARKKQERA